MQAGRSPRTGHPPPCWPLGLHHPWALQWGWWDKGRQVEDRSWGTSRGVLSWGSPIPAHGRSSQVPVELVLLLTVPVVDPDKDDLNWKRPLNCLHVLTSPLLCVLTLKSGACKSPGSPGHPGGDGTEMATKALGTAGALWSWHPIWGGEDGPAKSQAGRPGLQLDGSVLPPGVGVWAPWHPGPQGKMGQA